MFAGYRYTSVCYRHKSLEVVTTGQHLFTGRWMRTKQQEKKSLNNKCKTQTKQCFFLSAWMS